MAVDATMFLGEGEGEGATDAPYALFIDPAPLVAILAELRRVSALRVRAVAWPAVLVELESTGVDFLAIRLTDAQCRFTETMVFCAVSRRRAGPGGEPISGAGAARAAQLWLRLRRADEVIVSAGWRHLVMLEQPTVEEEEQDGLDDCR